MADYYPLLARALEALPDRSPEMRRTVYERARGALVGQLRSLDPPLSESDIDHERVALDEAIERLEAGFAGEPCDPVEAEEMPQAATLPAGPSLVPARGPMLPEPDPPSPEPSVPRLPTRREPRAPEAGAEAGGAEAGPGEEGARRPRLAVIRRPRDRAAVLRRVAASLALAVVVALIAVAAWLLRDKPSDLPVVASETGTARPDDGDAKFAERVGAGGAERAATAVPAGTAAAPAPTAPRPTAEAAAAPRAVLYEEDATNPQAPRATMGRVVWRLDAVNAGQGQPLETVVRGTVEVPDAGLTLNLLLRRNLDATLPASHTIELAFTTRGEGRALREAGVLQLKTEEAARGAPLAALPVPVRDNLFLIGLSSAPADVERNTDLILHRNWFDLPLRYAAGGRAVLSFEKGAAGEAALNDAFAQWR